MNRRAFLKSAALSCAAAGLSGCLIIRTHPSHQEQEPEQGQELIRDPHFVQGFHLIDPVLRHQDYAQWRPFDSEPDPVWKMAQWSTREKLLPASSPSLANSCKKVSVARKGAQADLILEVDGNEEYQGVPRSQPSEPWVHLLVEQGIETKPRLVDLASLQFHLEAKLLSSQLYRPELFDAGKHAAQYQVFFYLQDLNKESKGYGEMIWFGIPIYDNRQRKTPRYEALDFAGSGMFICTLAHEDLCPDSAHDGRWITLEADLLGEMKRAFEIAQKKGFMQKTRSLEDMHLTGMNMGWEVPGLLDVSLQVRNLSLRAKGTPSLDGK